MATSTQPQVPTISLNHPDIAELFCESLRESGAVVVADCYTPLEIQLIRTALIEVESRESLDDPSYIRQADVMWAIWNLYEHSPAMMRLALAPKVMCLMHHHFRQDVEFCRGTLIKKTPLALQSMGWHQDRPAPVDRDLADAESVGVRAGVPHRNLPDEVLLNHYMIVRIHVDEQHIDGGALRIVPGSCKLGILDPKDWNTRAEERPNQIVPAPIGSVLFASPLTLHTSGPNTRNDPSNHRRVLHTEFRTASSSPGAGLSWYPWPHGATVTRNAVTFTG